LDRRFSPVAVLLILAAGALYLWLHPEQSGTAQNGPIASAKSINSDTALRYSA